MKGHTLICVRGKVMPLHIEN